MSPQRIRKQNEQNQPINQEDQEIDCQKNRRFFFQTIGFGQWPKFSLYHLSGNYVGLIVFVTKLLLLLILEIILMPNFSSNDYLYSKINLINAKIAE
jgi:hypothetical protein